MCIRDRYDDAGTVNYIPNDGICCTADPDFGSIALAGNPLTVYGVPFTYLGDYFQVANLTASGLTYTRPTGTSPGPNTTIGNQVISDGTLLYTSAGQVWNPATQTQVGTIPVTTFNDTSYPNNRNITLDPLEPELFVVGEEDYANDSDALVIAVYSTKTFALTGALPFPQLLFPAPTNLVRWGANGFGFLGWENNNPSQQVLYLTRSSIAQPASSNPVPNISSLAPTSYAGQEGIFPLTVYGSDFVPASVVNWNGTAILTNYVSNTELTATYTAAMVATCLLYTSRCV